MLSRCSWGLLVLSGLHEGGQPHLGPALCRRALSCSYSPWWVARALAAVAAHDLCGGGLGEGDRGPAAGDGYPRVKPATQKRDPFIVTKHRQVSGNSFPTAERVHSRKRYKKVLEASQTEMVTSPQVVPMRDGGPPSWRHPSLRVLGKDAPTYVCPAPGTRAASGAWGARLGPGAPCRPCPDLLHFAGRQRMQP